MKLQTKLSILALTSALSSISLFSGGAFTKISNDVEPFIPALVEYKYTIDLAFLATKPKVSSSWSLVPMKNPAKVDHSPGISIAVKKADATKNKYQFETELLYIDMCSSYYIGGFENLNYYIKYGEYDYYVGAGLGLGHFTTDLTNDKQTGLNAQLNAKMVRSVNENLDLVVGAKYIYTNLETQEGSTNIHKVSLDSFVGLKIGIEYKF